MNYERIYNDFIADRRIKETGLVGYTENHHILPRSLGGGDTADNLIRLSGADHVLAHYYLAKIHGGDQWLPIVRMSKKPATVVKAYSEHEIITKVAPIFEEAKKAHAEHLSKKKKGKPVSQFIEHNATRENKTVYSWEHKVTGEKIQATLREMSSKTGVDINKLSCVAHGINVSRNGWKLEGTHIADRNEWMSDKTKVAEWKRKIVAKNKEYDRSYAKGENNARARKVICIETKEVFGCIQDAANATGAQRANINRAIRDSKTAGGYRWAYADTMKEAA